MNTEKDYNDDALVKQLSGFKNNYQLANGIKIHYVTGGQGEPLVLIPGWPQTWWSYRKIMPILAKKYSLIVIDLRGMGSSEKPLEGYAKKTMATDVLSLITQLGYKKVNIAGHDIGASVAFSYAANFPESTDKLILLDTPHPDENMYKLPMLPIGAKIYPWWIAFNQVNELPENLLEGRYHILQNWIFDKLLINKEAINSFDRKVFSKAYDNKEAIRSSNEWYKAFTQDILDMKTIEKITVPTIGIGSVDGVEMFKYSLPPYINDLQLKVINNSGHFIHEENPDQTAQSIIDFLN
ncbi:alpha/beta hydrolase [Flavobacteriaceae bacterium CRH]|nr:alpha/beta hydrolase [Flavobacteriaceae bacterium CRH]